MNILGLYDGHLSTATLLVDGRIVAMTSEERFTRKKNQGGAPERSIAWVLEQGGLSGGDIDAVALAMLTQPFTAWEEDIHQSRRRLFRVASALLPRAIAGSRALVKPYVRLYRNKRDWAGLNGALKRNGISPALYAGHRYEHHLCHAATAYYLSWFRDETKPMLIVTTDGSGDGLCATVSIGHKGRLERQHEIPSYHSIGELYTRVTEMLGMRPLDHEYKVMGLAPYAPPAIGERAYQVFKSYFRLTSDGLGFENICGKWGPALRDRMVRDLQRIRFDGIAYGVQKLVEEIMTGFVLGWVRKTGIRSVGVAGGVFMNVKVNMLLSERPEIDEIFLMPSCGDESIGLGAALLTWADVCHAAGRPVDVPPLEHVALGPQFSRDQILAELERRADAVTWREVDDIEAEVARLVAEGQIVARLADRMEWGARSLGNRAILADPRDLGNVRRINHAIKMRDFWMPFAPSILEERASDYLQNPRGLRAPFMINAFRSTPLGQHELICGLHPVDMTCRPQIVRQADNPRYHRLLKEFERTTGVGGLVNTSFNLHGEPIVCGPSDAIHTLCRSGLDAVAIEHFLVRRKGEAA